MPQDNIRYCIPLDTIGMAFCLHSYQVNHLLYSVEFLTAITHIFITINLYSSPEFLHSFEVLSNYMLVTHV